MIEEIVLSPLKSEGSKDGKDLAEEVVAYALTEGGRMVGLLDRETLMEQDNPAEYMRQWIEAYVKEREAEEGHSYQRRC